MQSTMPVDRLDREQSSRRQAVHECCMIDKILLLRSLTIEVPATQTSRCDTVFLITDATQLCELKECHWNVLVHRVSGRTKESMVADAVLPIV